MMIADGSKVFVREYGTGGRPARVVKSYTDSAGIARILVDFEDTTDIAKRDCFATSVFATKAEAEEASK